MSYGRFFIFMDVFLKNLQNAKCPLIFNLCPFMSVYVYIFIKNVQKYIKNVHTKKAKSLIIVIKMDLWTFFIRKCVVILYRAIIFVCACVQFLNNMILCTVHFVRYIFYGKINKKREWKIYGLP